MVGSRRRPANIEGDVEFPGSLNGGAEGIRTPDPHNAIVVLYQLSYDPDPSDGKSRGTRWKVKGFPEHNWSQVTIP